jgi:phosphatidylserine/phosphatidylglycerophosphate/cardiolipin synthase-like enzyme
MAIDPTHSASSVPPLAKRAVTTHVAAVGGMEADRLAIAATPSQLSGHLKVDLRDADGFARTSEADITGSLTGTLRIEPAYVLARLQDAIKSDASKTITSIKFDPAKGAYVVSGRARIAGMKILPGPSFQIMLMPGPDGQFEVSAHSWADAIAHLLKRPDATASLGAQLSKLQPRVGIAEHQGHFYLDILKGMTLPFGAFGGEVKVTELSGPRGYKKISVDRQGALSFSLTDAHFSGGTRQGAETKAQQTPDTAHLALDFSLHPDNQIAVRITGDVDANLDADTVQRLAGANPQILEPLGKGAHIKLEHLVVDGTFNNVRNWRSAVNADVNVLTGSGLGLRSPLTGIVDGQSGQSQIDLMSPKLTYALVGEVALGGVHATKDAQGVTLHLQPGGSSPFNPLPATNNNRLGLAIGGVQWEATLLDTISRAKHYVHGETFDFSEGTETQKIITAMAERAAGISLESNGIRFDDAPIAIRVMVDGHGQSEPGWALRSVSALKGSGTEPWAVTLRQAIATGQGKYSVLTKAQRDKALTNMAANLDFRETPGGALRTDHRKIWLADGGFGITGGMNLDDCMLGGVHDVMLPTIGPAVHDLATAWTTNWEQLGAPLRPSERPLDGPGMKRAAKPFESLVDAGNHQVQVLVTDDHQAEIGEAMVRAIDGAKQQIRLEHAYFTDDRVIEALAKALDRGVGLEIVTPEIPAEPFLTGNRVKLMSLLDHAAKPGAGKLNVAFYQQNGEYRFHNHLKALSVDGKVLLVGSGNIDQRGLEGSLQGDGNRLLFNRELDYQITDAAYVARFDREIFDHDHNPGDAKSLLEKVAEHWAYPGLAEGNKTMERFHATSAFAATQELMDHLQKSAESAFSAATERVPGTGFAAKLRTPATERQLLETQNQTFAALAAGLESARKARESTIRAFGADPSKARIALEASLKVQQTKIAAQLPEGLARTVALDNIDRAKQSLLQALEKAKPGEYPAWFVEELDSTVAQESIRAASLPGRNRLAKIMAEAPTATWEPEIRKTLTPSASEARKHDAFSFLF